MSKKETQAGAESQPPEGTDDEAEARAALFEAAANGDTEALKKLTKEEQLALYERKLKEDDWGHQPC